LRIANEEHTKTYSCMRYNEHTHATTNNRYALLVIRDYKKDPISITYGPSKYQLPTIM